jgi:hypothetical protein
MAAAKPYVYPSLVGSMARMRWSFDELGGR